MSSGVLDWRGTVVQQYVTGHGGDVELGREYMDDPYRVLAGIREEYGIRRVMYHGVPAWLVTRYDDVRDVFTNHQLSSRTANASDEVRAVPWIAGTEAAGLNKAMINSDPPEHTRLRRLAVKAFTSRRVDALREPARQMSARLIDDGLARGEMDFLSEFAVPLACQVIMKLVGVPAMDSREFQRRSSVLLSTDPKDLALLPETLQWLTRYFDDLVASKRAEPGDDLLSELVTLSDNGDRLDDDELRSTTGLLLVAGFATTSGLISNGLLALLTRPEQLAALRADPALIPNAVEEMLRYDTPATASLPHFATTDLTLAGADIRRGDAVIVCLGAANRDPRRFDDPDTFDIHRADTGHISFGYGIHYCLGAQLARMEAQIAFTVLFERCRDIALAVPFEELTWQVTPHSRGLVRFPVTLK
jgi:cytochrome P450